MNTGIVVFAHGSSVASANDAVRTVVASMSRDAGYDLVETAFLELASPTLEEAVERVIQRGARRVLIIPYFLTLGIHLQRDLPRIVSAISSVHTDVEIQVTEPLDGHPALSRVLADRARHALEKWR